MGQDGDYWRVSADGWHTAVHPRSRSVQSRQSLHGRLWEELSESVDDRHIPTTLLNSTMPDCPRCGSDVERLRMLPPAAMTQELVEAIAHDADGEISKGEVEVCTTCADEILEE